MRQRDGVISEAIYYVRRPHRPRRGLPDLSNKCYSSALKCILKVFKSSLHALILFYITYIVVESYIDNLYDF